MVFNQLFSYSILRTFTWQAIGFTCIFGLRELGVHHLSNTPIFIAVLGSIIYAMFWTNSDMMAYVRKSWNKYHLLLLFGLYLAVLIVYANIRVDLRLVSSFKNMHFAHMDYTYVATKSIDITFQQVAFAMYVFDLLQRKMNMKCIQISSMALLSASHAMTLLSLPTHIAVIFMIAAAIGGLIFPPLITHPKGGFFPAFTLHWLYYLGMGIAVNVSMSA